MALKRMHQEQEEGYYNNRGEYIPKTVKPIFWDCPKCRHEYEPLDIPRHYECFCKKGIPENHLWLLPHSCGETCGKPLEPNCGHKCVLLCHPGPCPPCPQTIAVSCQCQLSKPKTIRCSQRTWTCHQKCPRKLACGIHKCEQPCHTASECPPCKKKSPQKCACGQETKDRNCYELNWHCKKVCGKSFNCGSHRCEKVCHKDDCGPCPRSLPRFCPCGKEETIAPCSEDVTESCGDTCQKLLACGLHNCEQRCHKGQCSACMEFVEKACRCGLTTKSFTCSKVFP
jgi:NF-X1-type zinc finger protein NFXL1